MVEKEKSVLKTKFFRILFSVPSIIWVILSLIAMIPDETETDPLTWSDVIGLDIFILLVWFAISFLISFIVCKLRKKRNRNRNNNKTSESIVIDNKTIDGYSSSKESNYLFACESILDAYEYKTMAKYFPQIYWSLVKNGIIINIGLSLLVGLISSSVIISIIFFIFYQIYIMVEYKARLDYFAEKSFNALLNKGGVDTNIHTEFYEDYLIRRGEFVTRKFNYSDLDKCIETDTNFYFKEEQRNLIIIIQKNRCDLELLNFIRSKFDNLENCLGDEIKFDKSNKYRNPNFIKKGMITLFVITILSLWGSLFLVDFVNTLIPQHGLNFTKNMWVCWCLLPIPLLSIILGFKFRLAGFKCTKNIVGGFIVGFLLIVYGSFCLLPTYEKEYSMIDKYRNIIDAKLPDKGQLTIQEYDTYFDEDKKNYSIINVYYDNEDVRDLVNSIENSDNWILSTNIKSELKIFVPSTLHSDNDAYFSIYNNTTKQYNTLPETAGVYEIYTMKYDKSDETLEIHKFKYEYR